VQEKKVVALTMLVTASCKPATGCGLAVDIVLTRERKRQLAGLGPEGDHHKMRRNSQFTGRCGEYYEEGTCSR
jgi:hypothetical protein